MLWFTEQIIRVLQKLGPRKRKAHLALGQHGESEAYFYLRRLGYRIVATNFRAPHDRGEIDLIGWDNDVLCFVEVKTRTNDSFAPPSTAVTPEKQKHIAAVAKAYLRRLAGESRPPCRFDVVSVVPATKGERSQITLRKGAFSWSTGRKREWKYRDYLEQRFRKADSRSRRH
jgi:putative endonuclease